MTKKVLHEFSIHGVGFVISKKDSHCAVLTEALFEKDTILSFHVTGNMTHVHDENGAIGWLKNDGKEFIFTEGTFSSQTVLDVRTDTYHLPDAMIFVCLRYLKSIYTKFEATSPKVVHQPGVASATTTMYLNDTSTNADPVMAPCVLSFDGSSRSESVIINVAAHPLELSILLSRRELMQLLTDSIAP